MISRLLDYDPQARLSSIEALVHPFFDELRNPETRLLNGRELPPLFNFTEQELSLRPDLIHKLVPAHSYPELLQRGIDVHSFTPIPLEKLQPMD